MSQITTTGQHARKAIRQAGGIRSHLLVPSAQLVEHWQNLAGEEVELTGGYTYEERDLADQYAHQFADYAVNLNDRGEA